MRVSWNILIASCVLSATVFADRAPFKPTEGLDKLNGLNPVFLAKARAVIALLEKEKWPLRIVWGKRTVEQNDELVKQGVASKDSRHVYCEAIDLIYNSTSDAYSPDHGHPYYAALATAVATVGGLKWGGDFKDRWDPTHFELASHGSGCP